MHVTFTLTVVAVLVALVGLAAVVAVARLRRGRVGPEHVVIPVVAVGVASVAGFAVVVVLVTGWFFTAFHFAYLVAVLALPAVGLGLAVLAARRRAGVAVWVVVALLVAPAPVGWYATHVAPFRLEVQRESLALPGSRAGSDPIRVAVLADLQTNHIGEYEERAVTLLLAQRPDVILLAGDYFQGNEGQFRRELPAFRRLFGRLQARGGVYAVRGDSDVGDRADQLFAGTDVQILDDEVVTTTVGDRRVAVGGNRLRWAPDVGIAARTELAAAEPGTVRLLVAHRPDVVTGFPAEADVDLVVAGHTHGGQIALPLVGPLVTFTTLPRSVAAGGLHEVGGHPIYVSPGVGMERNQAPQVRFLVPPRIGLVVLE